MSPSVTDTQRELLRKHTIVALDVDELEDALALAEKLTGWVDRVKIGSKMFTRYGPKVLDELGRLGKQVFLDLKYHDIPSVVGKACAEAAQHESVFLLTVHASGGTKMIEAALKGARSQSDGPSVVAVTALTSLSPSELMELGLELELDAWAQKLARLAQKAGADGIVCSALEASRMRAVLGDETILVTPGIRPARSNTAGDDQTRVMTPSDAIKAGSSYLVIGRPLYQAADPLAAATAIAETL